MKSLMSERKNDYLKMEESIGLIRPKKLEDVYSIAEFDETNYRIPKEIPLPIMFLSYFLYFLEYFFVISEKKANCSKQRIGYMDFTRRSAHFPNRSLPIEN